MKTMLISAASAVFLFGTAFAREVVISRVVTPAFAREVAISRVVTPHGANIVERHTAQLNNASGVLYETKYITTTSSDGRGPLVNLWTAKNNRYAFYGVFACCNILNFATSNRPPSATRSGRSVMPPSPGPAPFS